MFEEWRSIEGYEGYYEISNLGRVRSLDRNIVYINGKVIHRKGIYFKLQKDRNGYTIVNLSKEGVTKTKLVHHLVARSFIENVSGFPNVLHGAAGQKDNSVSNLKWGTQSENMFDKRRDKTNPNSNKLYFNCGHLLKEPNIMPYSLNDPIGQRCRSCSVAGSWVCKNKEFKPYEKYIADIKYHYYLKGINRITKKDILQILESEYNVSWNK